MKVRFWFDVASRTPAPFFTGFASRHDDCSKLRHRQDNQTNHLLDAVVRPLVHFRYDH